MKLGASVYKTKFNHAWKSIYPFIKEVKGDPYKFFCTTCSRSVSCEHQGKRDVERHTNKQLHQNNAKSLKSQSLIIFPTQQSSSDTEKVMADSSCQNYYTYIFTIPIFINGTFSCYLGVCMHMCMWWAYKTSQRKHVLLHVGLYT